MPNLERPKDFGPKEVVRISVDADCEGCQGHIRSYFTGFSPRQMGYALADAMVVIKLSLANCPARIREEIHAGFLAGLDRESKHPRKVEEMEQACQEREVDP